MQAIIHSEGIKKTLDTHRTKIMLSLKACAHCSLCAESCFLYMTKGKTPDYMPSHKAIHSIGVMYKKKGRLSTEEMDQIKDIVWKKCVLCQRCYCPFGIDIPDMIALARRICRSQNVMPEFDEVFLSTNA